MIDVKCVLSDGAGVRANEKSKKVNTLWTRRTEKKSNAPSEAKQKKAS